MSINLLTEHHLEFLSLRGDCRGSSESTHVKMLHCWKSHIRNSYLPLCCISSSLNDVRLGGSPLNDVALLGVPESPPEVFFSVSFFTLLLGINVSLPKLKSSSSKPSNI